MQRCSTCTKPRRPEDRTHRDQSPPTKLSSTNQHNATKLVRATIHAIVPEICVTNLQRSFDAPRQKIPFNQSSSHETVECNSHLYQSCSHNIYCTSKTLPVLTSNLQGSISSFTQTVDLDRSDGDSQTSKTRLITAGQLSRIQKSNEEEEIDSFEELPVQLPRCEKGNASSSSPNKQNGRFQADKRNEEPYSVTPITESVNQDLIKCTSCGRMCRRKTKCGCKQKEFRQSLQHNGGIIRKRRPKKVRLATNSISELNKECVMKCIKEMFPLANNLNLYTGNEFKFSERRIPQISAFPLIKEETELFQDVDTSVKEGIQELSGANQPKVSFASNNFTSERRMSPIPILEEERNLLENVGTSTKKEIQEIKFNQPNNFTSQRRMSQMPTVSLLKEKEKNSFVDVGTNVNETNQDITLGSNISERPTSQIPTHSLIKEKEGKDFFVDVGTNVNESNQEIIVNQPKISFSSNISERRISQMSILSLMKEEEEEERKSFEDVATNINEVTLNQGEAPSICNICCEMGTSTKEETSEITFNQTNNFTSQRRMSQMSTVSLLKEEGKDSFIDVGRNVNEANQDITLDSNTSERFISQIPTHSLIKEEERDSNVNINEANQVITINQPKIIFGSNISERRKSQMPTLSLITEEERNSFVDVGTNINEPNQNITFNQTEVSFSSNIFEKRMSQMSLPLINKGKDTNFCEDVATNINEVTFNQGEAPSICNTFCCKTCKQLAETRIMEEKNLNEDNYHPNSFCFPTKEEKMRSIDACTETYIPGLINKSTSNFRNICHPICEESTNIKMELKRDQCVQFYELIDRNVQTEEDLFYTQRPSTRCNCTITEPINSTTQINVSEVYSRDNCEKFCSFSLVEEKGVQITPQQNICSGPQILIKRTRNRNVNKVQIAPYQDCNIVPPQEQQCGEVYVPFCSNEKELTKEIPSSTTSLKTFHSQEDLDDFKEIEVDEYINNPRVSGPEHVYTKINPCRIPPKRSLNKITLHDLLNTCESSQNEDKPINSEGLCINANVRCKKYDNQNLQMPETSVPSQYIKSASAEAPLYYNYITQGDTKIFEDQMVKVQSDFTFGNPFAIPAKNKEIRQSIRPKRELIYDTYGQDFQPNKNVSAVSGFEDGTITESSSGRNISKKKKDRNCVVQ